MRSSSIIGRGSANRVYRIEGPDRGSARNGFPPLCAAVLAFAVAIFAIAELRAAPLEELFGVWVMDRYANAASADDTKRADGDLAVWKTAGGFGLTWHHLPPDPARKMIEFAGDVNGTRLEIVRIDPPLAAGERIEAWLEPGRLVVSIGRDADGAERHARYAFFIHDGRLVFDYRLQQGSLTIESTTRQLRRLKVVM